MKREIVTFLFETQQKKAKVVKMLAKEEGMYACVRVHVGLG